MSILYFLLMVRPTPRYTPTDPIFPSTPLCRAAAPASGSPARAQPRNPSYRQYGTRYVVVRRAEILRLQRRSDPLRLRRACARDAGERHDDGAPHSPAWSLLRTGQWRAGGAPALEAHADRAARKQGDLRPH